MNVTAFKCTRSKHDWNRKLWFRKFPSKLSNVKRTDILSFVLFCCICCCGSFQLFLCVCFLAVAVVIVLYFGRLFQSQDDCCFWSQHFKEYSRKFRVTFNLFVKWKDKLKKKNITNFYLIWSKTRLQDLNFFLSGWCFTFTEKENFQTSLISEISCF